MKAMKRNAHSCPHAVTKEKQTVAVFPYNPAIDYSAFLFVCFSGNEFFGRNEFCCFHTQLSTAEIYTKNCTPNAHKSITAIKQRNKGAGDSLVVFLSQLWDKTMNYYTNKEHKICSFTKSASKRRFGNFGMSGKTVYDIVDTVSACACCENFFCIEKFLFMYERER